MIFFRVFIIVSSVLAICTYGSTQSIEGECALHLNGPGRTSFFDFNTNTLRGGPQLVFKFIIFYFKYYFLRIVLIW